MQAILWVIHSAHATLSTSLSASTTVCFVFHQYCPFLRRLVAPKSKSQNSRTAKNCQLPATCEAQRQPPPRGSLHLPHHPGYQPDSEKAPPLHSQLQTIPNLLPSLPLQPWPASNQPWPVDTSQPGIQYFRPSISNSSVRHPLLSCPCSSFKPREKKKREKDKKEMLEQEMQRSLVDWTHSSFWV